MILEALFNGEIYASEDIVPKSDRFRQTAAHISEAMTYFKGELRTTPCLKNSVTAMRTRAT